jgi:hypothetical protein
MRCDSRPGLCLSVEAATWNWMVSHVRLNASLSPSADAVMSLSATVLREAFWRRWQAHLTAQKRMDRSGRFTTIIDVASRGWTRGCVRFPCRTTNYDIELIVLRLLVLQRCCHCRSLQTPARDSLAVILSEFWSGRFDSEAQALHSGVRVACTSMDRQRPSEGTVNRQARCETYSIREVASEVSEGGREAEK